MGSSGSGFGPVAACDKKKSNEHPSFIKWREISHPPSGYEVPTEEQKPCSYTSDC